MHYFEIVLLGAGLSFDTLAVSISTGINVCRIKFIQAIRIAMVLALVQAIMPYIGWLGGSSMGRWINDYGHWIAFILLIFLGIKMIIESFKKCEERQFNPLLFSVLLSTAIATSIDALVAGISMAFIGTRIMIALLIIGGITFLFSIWGIVLGKKINNRFGAKVEIIGGFILIAIGIRILASHLMG
jgi:manganese efflux pump family protein